MQKHIIGKNGISYTLSEDGLYYPDLKIAEGSNYEIGRYGRMRCEYLKSYHKVKYMDLLLSGELNEYLHGIDKECYERMELLIGQMKEREGVTEQLKADNQMKWVGMLNNIRSSAEEIVLSELVYQ